MVLSFIIASFREKATRSVFIPFSFAKSLANWSNSFHGTAFSINLQKQVFVFYPPRFKTRLDSILSLTGLEDRIAEGRHPGEMKEITTYDKVQEILNKERGKAEEFLKGALGNEGV